MRRFDGLDPLGLFPLQPPEPDVRHDGRADFESRLDASPRSSEAPVTTAHFP